VVLEVLWQRSPQSSREVVAAVAPATGWAPNTIKTLLGRLVQKGWLRTETIGNRFLYSPVSREEYTRKESRSFLQRVFDGRAGALLSHFVREAELTPEERRELRELLDEKWPKR
jgi:predicted transcriptional regulator